MKTEEVLIDGKKETIVVDFDDEFMNDYPLEEDYDNDNTMEFPVNIEDTIKIPIGASNE